MVELCKKVEPYLSEVGSQPPAQPSGHASYHTNGGQASYSTMASSRSSMGSTASASSFGSFSSPTRGSSRGATARRGQTPSPSNRRYLLLTPTPKARRKKRNQNAQNQTRSVEAAGFVGDTLEDAFSNICATYNQKEMTKEIYKKVSESRLRGYGEGEGGARR